MAPPRSSPIGATIPSHETTSSKLRSRPPLRRKWSGVNESTTKSRRSWARRTFRSCWKLARAPLFLSATATAPASTTRPTILTTKRSRSAPRIGSSWSKRRCRAEFLSLWRRSDRSEREPESTTIVHSTSARCLQEKPPCAALERERGLLRGLDLLVGRQLHWRLRHGGGLRQLWGDRGFDRSPIGECVKARAFQYGDRHRGEEWQTLHHKDQRENVELADLLVIRGYHDRGADQQQRPEHRLPKRGEVRSLAGGAALGGTHEGKRLLPHAAADRTRDRPLHGHGGNHRTDHLAKRNRDPQAIKRDKMGERDGESREDRDGEDLVGDGDADEGDDGYPDEIEDCHRNADRFRAQPVEPADREFAFLLARETAVEGQQMAPMLAQNLEAAIGPAIALLLISLESVG